MATYVLNSNIPSITVSLDSRHGKDIMVYNDIQKGGENSIKRFYLNPSIDPKNTALTTSRYILLSIIDSQIPFSSYLTNNANNKFRFIERDIGGGNENEYTVTIKPGNYNAYDLQDTLQSLINAAGGEFTWSITYSPTYLKYTFSVSRDDEVSTREAVMDFTASNSCHTQLGFGNDSLVVVDSANPTQSVNIADLALEHSYYVRSNLSAANFYESTNSANHLTTSTILAKIPLNREPGSILYNKQGYRILLAPRVITYIDISFTDQNGNYIDFHNVDWQMTLQFDFVELPPQQSP